MVSIELVMMIFSMFLLSLNNSSAILITVNVLPFTVTVDGIDTSFSVVLIATTYTVRFSIEIILKEKSGKSMSAA